MEQSREPGNKSSFNCQLIFWQGVKNTPWGKDSLLTNGIGKTGYPHAKETNWTFNFCNTQKSILHELDLTVILETIKIPRRKHRGKAHKHLSLHDFIYITAKKSNKNKQVGTISN